jgi:hypothetical protein
MFEMKQPGRRELLIFALAPVMVALAPKRAGAAGCPTDSELTSSELSLRKSAGFMPTSPNPAKVCGGCTFFKEPGATCGPCAILSSIVSNKSVCNSWAARP